MVLPENLNLKYTYKTELGTFSKNFKMCNIKHSLECSNQKSMNLDTVKHSLECCYQITMNLDTVKHSLDYSYQKV